MFIKLIRNSMISIINLSIIWNINYREEDTSTRFDTRIMNLSIIWNINEEGIEFDRFAFANY